MNDGLVWITGAGGLIGNYLDRTASKAAPNRRVKALTRSDLDLTDYSAVRRIGLTIRAAAQSGTMDYQAWLFTPKTPANGTIVS